nr:hypothetical protein [Leptospira weilii]
MVLFFVGISKILTSNIYPLKHAALQIVAKTPISETRNQSKDIEYTENLNNKEVFLRNPPYPLTPKILTSNIYPLKHVALQIEAKTPISDKRNQSKDIEYTENLNNKEVLLRNLPYPLTPKILTSNIYPLKHVALQIEAKSPFSDKRNQSKDIEYTENLNNKEVLLRNPPYPLTPKILTSNIYPLKHVSDGEGKTLSKTQYLPYGETFVQREDLNFAPKYNSQELDRESGFYFYNAEVLRSWDCEIYE